MGSKTSTMAESARPVSVDKVEYRLFPVLPEGISSDEELLHLEEQLDSCLAQLSTYLVDYIWQNQPFILRVVPGSGSLYFRLLTSDHAVFLSLSHKNSFQ